MKLFNRDLSRDIAVIAEVGLNHEGDPETASRLLRAAAEAGADAVKLQSYTPERYASSADPERLARLRRFRLDEAAHRRLAAEAQALNITLFSTPLSEDVVPFLDSLFPVFKIASGDLTFEPVIRAAARTGKPLIISTGAGTPEEIDRAVAWVRDEVGADALPERLVLMQCVSAYPTPVEQANAAAVGWLVRRYGVPSGYSNHVIGPEACLAAVALGASVIEVHVTDCKTGRAFRDHELSFEPHELKELIGVCRRVKLAVGVADKAVQDAEAGVLPLIRKGVVAARDLPVGTVLTADDLMFARPAGAFPAARIDELPGRRLAVAMRAGEGFSPDRLTPPGP